MSNRAKLLLALCLVGFTAACAPPPPPPPEPIVVPIENTDIKLGKYK